MLSLQLKSGEYLTIGDDIAVQIFQQSGSTFNVAVKAPREIPILRGEVRERTEERPDGLRSRQLQQPSRRVRNARKLDALTRRKERESAAVREIGGILNRMEAQGGTPTLQKEIGALRAQLELLTQEP